LDIEVARAFKKLSFSGAGVGQEKKESFA